MVFNFFIYILNIFKKIGFNFSVSYGSVKRWLVFYYVEVFVVLLEKGYEIYFFGVKEDVIVFEEILKFIKGLLKNSLLFYNVYNLCGKISIEELIERIVVLDLFIINDSGFMYVVVSM